MAIKTVIFHGPSGSGKDTQIDLLQETIKFERISVTQMMSTLRDEGHPLALKADEYGKQGKLYPDEIMYGMLEEWLSRLDPELPWIFASSVRKSTQIVLFDDLLKKFDRQVDLFIHFALSEEEAINRLSQRTFCPQCKATYHPVHKIEKNLGFCDNDGEKLIHREDDTPEAIKNRLSWYNDDIKPIADEYRNRGVFVEIDATPSIPEIHKEVVKALKINEK